MRHVFNLHVLIIAAVSSCLAWSAAGQVMTLEPEQPRWGDELVVTYDTSADGAQILASQRVRLVGDILVLDHEVARVGRRDVATVDRHVYRYRDDENEEDNSDSHDKSTHFSSAIPSMLSCIQKSTEIAGSSRVQKILPRYSLHLSSSSFVGPPESLQSKPTE